MEMHQIRYFIAVSETLNLTKAAERCNVAQPSLTRAIKASRNSRAFCNFSPLPETFRLLHLQGVTSVSVRKA